MLTQLHADDQTSLFENTVRLELHNGEKLTPRNVTVEKCLDGSNGTVTWKRRPCHGSKERQIKYKDNSTVREFSKAEHILYSLPTQFKAEHYFPSKPTCNSKPPSPSWHPPSSSAPMRPTCTSCRTTHASSFPSPFLSHSQSFITNSNICAFLKQSPQRRACPCRL